jgi:aminoglycoside 2''-phosphotransferase
MDTALAAELIEAQFAELAPAHVTFLGAGCDSTAFQVNDGIVFRFPRNRAVERQIDIEDRILPELARHLPVRVPLFRFRGRPSLRFDRRFIGYQKLPGEPGIRLPFDGVLLERIAGPLARVLDALHAFPVESARRAGVPEERLESMIREVRVDALGDLDRVREVAADAPIGRWRHFIEDGVQSGQRRDHRHHRLERHCD